MPIHRLAQTEHFDIEWWSGVDSNGLYLLRRLTADLDEWGSHRSRPHIYVSLSLVPDLISELREGSGNTTLISRVDHDFNPTTHRQPKKDGGDPAKSYYIPLDIQSAERSELAGAMELACDKENVNRLEENNSSEGYYVLGYSYLQNGSWHSLFAGSDTSSLPKRDFPKPILLSPTVLEQEPTERFLPWGIKYGVGKAVLRSAKVKYKCSSVGTRRGSQGCIDYVWIDPSELYVEHKQGSRPTARYHLKCAFRAELIPDNWLSPHFEQYYMLVEHGLKNWIDKEREKRADKETPLQIPSMKERVMEFVQKLGEDYTLDEYERRDWREHLRDCPVDIEPFQTARELVGLPNPSTQAPV